MEELSSTLDEYTRLVKESQGQHGSSSNWRGADVIVTDVVPSSDDPTGCCPAPRYIVTKFSGDLSWLFESLEDAFDAHLNAQNKIEFFGRLANVANRHIRKHEADTTSQILLLAVLHEAYAIAEEIAEDGFFDPLALAASGEILNDFLDEVDRKHPASDDEARRALLKLGIEL